jgi:iron complex outermembrane receptor protein
LLGENTSLEYQGSYTRDRSHLDSGLTVLNGNPRALPIQRSLNEPDDFRQFSDYKNGLWLTHRINENWTARAGGYAGWYNLPSLGTVPIINGNTLPFFGLPNNTLLRQVQTNTDSDEAYYSFIGNIAGKFDGAFVRHNLVLGTELGWFHSNNFLNQFSDPLQPVALGPFAFPFPSSPINPTAPFYGAPNPPLVGFLDSQYSQDRYGFYAQDIMDVTSRWHILTGLRYDFVDFHFRRTFVSPVAGQDIGFGTAVNDQRYYHLSPRVGTSYEIVPDYVSLYASYSQSFDPPPGGAYRANINPKPVLGHQGEAGIRVTNESKRLIWDAAGFYIVKDNVVTQDNFFFATQIGQQRSQGFETSLTGQVTQLWSIVANYSYVDSRITRDPVLTRIGDRFRNVPFNTANIWTRLNVIDTQQQTLGFGLGIVAMDNRPGDLDNTFSLPSFIRYDAGMFYRYGRMNASLYLENLFDRRYETSSVDQFSVFPGAPLTARATVGVTF